MVSQKPFIFMLRLCYVLVYTLQVLLLLIFFNKMIQEYITTVYIFKTLKNIPLITTYWLFIQNLDPFRLLFVTKNYLDCIFH